MGLIADIRRLLQPPLPAEDDIIPPAPTMTDYRAGLDRMLLEETEAREIIAASPQRRTELLLEEGSDASIKRLERMVDAAHLQLERIEVLRPELQARIQALQVATRAEAWLATRSQLVEQLLICSVAHRAAEEASARLFNMKLEAMNSGFSVESDVVPLHIQQAPSGSFTQMAHSLSRRVAWEPPASAQLFNLRFREWTAVVINPLAGPTAFQAGQEGGFVADLARKLIKQGVAELADPKPLPPAPKKKIGPRRTQVEQLQFEAAQTGGRRPSAERETPDPLPPEHPTRTWTKLDTLPGGA